MVSEHKFDNCEAVSCFSGTFTVNVSCFHESQKFEAERASLFNYHSNVENIKMPRNKTLQCSRQAGSSREASMQWSHAPIFLQDSFGSPVLPCSSSSTYRDHAVNNNG